MNPEHLTKKITTTFAEKPFMQLTEVTNDRLARRFLQVNIIINGNNPNYIRPLDKDINNVFDRSKNKALRHSEIIRWILEDNDAQPIGRIAAFVNKKYKNRGDDMSIGGIGFFECINNQNAADMLFNVAKHWLIQRGMEAMDGPINCGERDRWWGLLVEGFDPPPYCVNYNPPYYKELFEQYGFQRFYNQLCFSLNVVDPIQQKFYERRDIVAKNPDISARHLRKRELEKYAIDFATVYNKAWAGHGGLKEIKKDMVIKMFRQMKPVMDEKIMWYVYEKNEPIAIWINLPDLNQWFKYLNGKFNLFAKLKFLWVKRTKRCNKFTGLVFGIVPEWQGKGIDAYVIVEGGVNVIQQKKLYDYYEMQWIGEFNPKMVNIALSLGTYRSRTLVTYRYIFDRMKEFKEHPIF